MNKNTSRNAKSIIICLLTFCLFLTAFYFMNNGDKQEPKYSEIISMFKNNEVQTFELDLTTGAMVYNTFKEPKTPKKYNVKSVSIFLDDIRDSVNEYNEANPDNQISFNYKVTNSRSWILSLLPILISVAGLVFFGWFIMKKMGDSINGEASRSLGFGKVKAKIANESKDSKTFEDVAGCDEEKEDLEELVDFLKDPNKFTELGARIPKGVLLVGPPGTGKTLLAKAVAGEAGVPFLSISGSDFVEMYVGVGASRVRDLFNQAMKKAPAIVFIDEIDAVGRHRGTGMGNSNDEREQTLNQLLVEMDGFGTNSGVIIMAATNRPDVLDPALLRPGRFDRQITVNKPDLKGREDILKVHARNKPLAPDVDFSDIAKNTMGFTGADLENLLNEAALLAARRHKHAVSAADIQDSSIKVMMGAEKKSHKYSDKAKKLTAYHEAGHAVVSYYLEYCDPVQEISIIPRGLGAGGYTMYQPQEENYTSKNEMLSSLVSFLGGRVAEEISLEDVSTGASNDLQRATQICRDMVAKYGMSDDIGPVVYSDESQEVFLGKDYSHVNNYSEATSARIDSEIERMMRNAYDLTKNILTTHNDKLVLVAETLLDKEKISREEFEALMKTGALPVDDEENAEETSDDETEPKDEVSENISEEADAESEDNTVEASDDIVVEDTQKTEEELISKEETTEEDNEESIENND
ncbi:MAG: ATP-dependent zinc metalloprotease FtsH [Eubacterium sp.]|nr:ATP-dependent zinc metalloprotease FtsH [Eubacterium sp.]